MRTKSYGQLEREIESLEAQVQFLQDELEAAMRLKDSAVAAEREACAQLAENGLLGLTIAKAIRARSEQ